MDDTIGTEPIQQTGRTYLERLQLLVVDPIFAAELARQWRTLWHED